MATVTKIKAGFQNDNLPILGPDGNLYNSYVGRWINKVSNYGYSPTATEINALNAFITTGIADGWIDKIMYLMPFIGSQENPVSGLVPLVDRLADYDDISEDFNEDLFTYSDGKIACYGGDTATSGNLYIPLPFTINDIPGKGFSVYVNIYIPNSVTITQNAYLAQTHDGSKIGSGLRLPSDLNPQLCYLKTSESAAIDGFIKIESALNSSTKYGLYTGVYTNSENLGKVKYHLIVSGQETPMKIRMQTPLDTQYYSDNSAIYRIGGATNRYTGRMNIYAVIDPLTITAEDMLSFNGAVNTLTTALGR